MFATVTSQWQFGPFSGSRREVLPGEVFYLDSRQPSSIAPRRERTLTATWMGARLDVLRINDPELGFYSRTNRVTKDIPARRLNLRIRTLVPGLTKVISTY